MTPVNALAKGLEICGIEPSLAVPLAAKAVQEMRKSYAIVELTTDEPTADALRRKGFTAGGTETIRNIILQIGAR